MWYEISEILAMIKEYKIDSLFKHIHAIHQKLSALRLYIKRLKHTIAEIMFLEHLNSCSLLNVTEDWETGDPRL